MNITPALTQRVETSIHEVRDLTTTVIRRLHECLDKQGLADDAQADLKQAEMHAVANGMVEGSNETARKAHLAQLTAQQQQAVQYTARDAARARTDLEIARLELDAARATRESLHLLAALAGAKATAAQGA